MRHGTLCSRDDCNQPRSNHSSLCRDHRNEKGRDWAGRNRETLHRGNRRARLRRKFGMTEQEYDKLLASQGGACAICGSLVPGGKGGFTVDHDHNCCPSPAVPAVYTPGPVSCGRCIRGLLCNNCNLTLGKLGDDPDQLEAWAKAAAQYLRERNV